MQATKKPQGEKNLGNEQLKYLDKLNINGSFALLTRASRRLFPLLQGESDIEEFNNGIALAEAFVLGKSVYLTDAKDIVDSLGQVDVSDYKTKIKDSIKLLAESAIFALEDNKADKHDFVDKTKSKLKETYKQLIGCVNELNDDYLEKWNNSLKQDFETLKKSHGVECGDIGVPINPSNIGLLGLLWSQVEVPELYMKEAKNLYQIPELNFEKFDKSRYWSSFNSYIYWGVNDNTNVDEIVMGREYLDKLNINGSFALLTRASRRLFPLLEGESDIEEFNNGIALAEAFVLGKSVYLTDAEDIVDSLGQVDGSDDITKIIKASIKLLAESAIFAIKARLSEDNKANKYNFVNQTNSKLKETYEQLIVCVNELNELNDDYPEKWNNSLKQDNDDYPLKQDNDHYPEKWNNSLKQDFETLKKSHGVKCGDIGVPIDPSNMGPLGLLWSQAKAPELYMEKAKKLYQIPEFNFEKFDKSRDWSSFNGYIYWGVNDSTNVDEIVTGIKNIQNDYFPKNKLPPIFIVFTDKKALNLSSRRKLHDQGATIYDDGQSDSPEEAADSLKRRLELGHVGWGKEGNFWVYKDSLTLPVKKTKVSQNHAK
jgi:hypothetical protein